MYEPWDEARLPSPSAHADDEEKQWAGKVNEIFLSTVTYLLSHEYAHIKCGHFQAENAEIDVEQEKEADNFALSFLIDDASTEKQRQVAGASVVLLCASNLFLAPEFRMIFKRRHPRSHDRLRHALSGLNLITEEARYYLYYLASIRSVASWDDMECRLR